MDLAKQSSRGDFKYSDQSVSTISGSMTMMSLASYASASMETLLDSISGSTNAMQTQQYTAPSSALGSISLYTSSSLTA